jgi:hypothetical protein
MKKSIAILLAVLYLLFNVGVILKLHLCDKTIDGISLTSEPLPCCPNRNSCCQDLTFQLSIKADYTSSDFLDFKVTKTFEYAVINVIQATLIYDALPANPSPISGASLAHSKTPIYLSNRILLI